MMSHFEEIGAQGARPAGQQTLLLGSLGIADQKRRAPSERDPNDERVVVGVGERDRTRAGGENLDVGAAPRSRTPAKGAWADDRNAAPPKPCKKCCIGRAGALDFSLPGVPEFAHVDA